MNVQEQANSWIIEFLNKNKKIKQMMLNKEIKQIMMHS